LKTFAPTLFMACIAALEFSCGQISALR
jgi:hypothetical protein